MIRCNISRATYRRTASAKPPAWARCFCAPERRASAFAAELAHHDSSTARRHLRHDDRGLIRLKEIQRMKKALNEILMKHTGKSVEQIEKDCDRITLCPPSKRAITASWTPCSNGCRSCFDVVYSSRSA